MYNESEDLDDAGREDLRRTESSGVYVVGLTGGIASGKSTVSRILRDLGAVIVDADLVSREVTAPESEGLQEVVRVFGKEIILPNGSLDRKALGSVIFRDEDARRKLDSILHPLVMKRINEILQCLRMRGLEKQITIMAVLDAPLLFEVGADKLVDEVWVVATDLRTQTERLMKRDGYSQEEAELRIRAQMPLSEKVRRAEAVIDNQRTIDETRISVEKLWSALERRVLGRPGIPNAGIPNRHP